VEKTASTWCGDFHVATFSPHRARGVFSRCSCTLKADEAEAEAEAVDNAEAEAVA
jgi:hypothetical protein